MHNHKNGAVMNLAKAASENLTFVPVVTVRQKIEDLAQRFSLEVENAEDDFDEFKVAYVNLGSRVFCLLHYRQSNEQTTEVAIPPRLPDFENFITEVLGFLKIDKSDVLPRKVNYRAYDNH